MNILVLGNGFDLALGLPTKRTADEVYRLFGVCQSD